MQIEREFFQSSMALSKQQVPFMDKPIAFLCCDDNNEFYVSEEAKTFLKNVTTPISVVAVAGRYRTGKSYLLNRLFSTNKGFDLGSSVQSQTKGIWMWARPHPRNRNMLLILLDTEGLHDVKKGDQMHDIKLFSLAILLSKCLVYNAMGSIDERAIKELELVTHMTEYISIEDRVDEEEGGIHFGKYFPNLFVVLRDFFLDLNVDGKCLSSDEYLEDALRHKPGRGKKIEEYNKPREYIRDFFPKRKCFTLCKPVEDDKKLKTIDDLPESELKEEFVQSSKECVNCILDHATQFEVNQFIITGKRYLVLAEAYVKAVNDDSKVPCVESTIQYMKEGECRKVAEKAMAKFKQVMDETVPNYPVDIKTLKDAQAKAFEAANETFDEKSILDNEGKYRKELAEALEKQYTECMIKNSESSRAKCQSLLDDIFKEVMEKNREGSYNVKNGYAKYCKDKDDAVAKYNAITGKGPEEAKVRDDYLEKKKDMGTAIRNADKALDAQEKELKKIEEEKQLEKERARALEAERKQMQEDLQRQAQDQRTMMEKIQRDLREQQQKHEQEMKAEREAKEKEYQRLVNEGMTKQAEQQKLVIEQLVKEKERSEKDGKEHMQRLENLLLQSQIKNQQDMTMQEIQNMRAQMHELAKKESSCAVM